MLVAVYLVLLGVLAALLRPRIALLAGLAGFPGYLAALGLTLFAADWVNFLAHALAGWNWIYWIISWSALLGGIAMLAGPRDARALAFSGGWTWMRHSLSPRNWNGWFLFLLGFVMLRFYTGIVVDDDDRVWVNFNFVDTAFHLSVVNAFLDASSFPPMDLDMAPYPLKYHFLADFFVAHLTRLGADPLSAMWLMNLVSAAVLVGTLWSVFSQWLKLPARWIMLGGLVFLFLNTSLVNLVHYLWLRPPYFHLNDFYYGLFWFPYFNFEALLTNLFEPQRALLFTMPLVLLALHGVFGSDQREQESPRLLQAFLVVCLLPFAHIVGFAVVSLSLVPALWRHRIWFFQRWRAWLPAFALGLLQLLYLQAYGPSAHPGYASWDATASLPLEEYTALPPFLRRAAFWFFVNGDFLGWGAAFVAIAFLLRRARDGQLSAPLLSFLHRWRWYFAVCLLLFAIINFYRYSFSWGDSNKFVLFLNLGLTLVIVLGAARWTNTRLSAVSLGLWWFFTILCITPHAYGFYRHVLASSHPKILLFDRSGIAAAEWLKNSGPSADELIVTAPYNIIHFVTPLAGLPTLAGIYSDSNPYRQDERADQIRRIYEHCDLPLLRELDAGLVCISRNERRKLKLHPRWVEFMRNRTAIAFHVGGGPEDFHSVYLFDVKRLPRE